MGAAAADEKGERVDFFLFCVFFLRYHVKAICKMWTLDLSSDTFPTFCSDDIAYSVCVELVLGASFWVDISCSISSFQHFTGVRDYR